MNFLPEPDRVAEALRVARERLLSARHPQGYWEGRLSSSALSTATALSAFSLAAADEDRPLRLAALRWLAADQNPDGGWGDTPDSPSNLSTTLLTVAALTLAPEPETREALPPAREHLRSVAGEDLASAITARYGADRTFAVPILTNCALAGLVSWRRVPPLPFALAALPASWYRALRLQVVSYALPALIAVGLVGAHHRPGTLAARLARRLAPGLLRQLEALQPASGGYLEAAPLTSFVAMSLLACDLGGPVVERGLRFLRETQRPDGSWPIDTNLATWVTTGAVNALALSGGLPPAEADTLRRWLVAQQGREVHPFTRAAPGGWGWTPLSGSVPDADDTSGALLALVSLGEREALPAGVRWLLGLQNPDGGWPTFCRGWGRLPFDRSCPDLTAHALRALHAAAPDDPLTRRALSRGLACLRATQRPDGSWLPLWFGSQQAPEQANPVLGTSRVLPAWAALAPRAPEALRGVDYLLRAQAPEGGWGAAPGVPPTVEETALAISALCAFLSHPAVPPALASGAHHLTRRLEEDNWTTPSPLGLYFASLWYAEDLYPQIWTVEALGRALLANSAAPNNVNTPMR